MVGNNVKKEYIRLLIMILIILIVLGGAILYFSIPLLSTKTVILDTQPVDPFDLIRGQYIVIRYEIGTIPKLPNANAGDTIYVALEEDSSGISRYKSASLEKPDNLIFIKGKIKDVFEDRINVEYGIEQYFFERGAQFSTRNLTVKVKLSDTGGARITELLEDGKPIEVTYREKDLTS